MRRILALMSIMALMVAAMAMPAAAAPTVTGGLVNVVVDDVTVQLPVAIAANVCDVNIAVLVEQFQDGAATCEADSTAMANAPGNRNPNR